MSDAGASAGPSAAGMYDYLLGGTANEPADRTAAERIRRALPEASGLAWANRGFLQRAVRRMAGEWGVRQFLDLGAGLPTAGTAGQQQTHDLAGPQSRVVYVDIDPAVVARGEQLLSGVERAAIVAADVRDTVAVLAHRHTRRLIDFARPVGLLMGAVVEFIPNGDDPWSMVRRYLDALAPGSYLALSAATGDYQAPRIVDAVAREYAATPTSIVTRTRAEVSRFFDGLEVVPPYPGADPIVTHVGAWGAEDPAAADDDASRWMYAAVGRKPEGSTA